MNEATIIAAVGRLNEQLHMLPDDVPCSLEDLYPNFDFPECGPEVYLALREDRSKRRSTKPRKAKSTISSDYWRCWWSALLFCGLLTSRLRLETTSRTHHASA